MNTKNLRVAVLVHESLIPPDSLDGRSDKEIANWQSEYDVISTLREQGFEVRPIGLGSDLAPLRESILDWKPDIAFVMLEEFLGVATYDQALVSYLELMRQPYTGCNPRGMMLTKDKALAKKILLWQRIPTPHFQVFPLGKGAKRPKRLAFPLFVKSLTEDASLGISQASVVYDDQELTERVKFIHDKVNSDAIAERFIKGRELYVGVMGNDRLQTFPIWEMVFDKLPDGVARIATRKAKWDADYQAKCGIATKAAENLPPKMDAKILRLCKRVYRSLNLSGYARIDLRLTDEGEVYILEANPNPNLARGEDFAESAATAGIAYDELLGRIITLGLRYQAPWKTNATE